MTAYDYGFRIYNPGIAKFLSVDPLTKDYPFYTPYQFAGNTPIQALDLDGLEPIRYDESTDTYFDERHGKGTASCLVNNEYTIIGRPINFEVYMPEYKVPTEVKVMSMIPVATGVILYAGPLIAAEACLLGGISWASLPAVQSYISTAGTFTLFQHTLAGVLDAGGQYGALRMNNDHNTSVSKINWTSAGLTFLNPGSKVGVLTFNAVVANSLQINFDEGLSIGEMNEVINGTIGEVTLGVTVGKIGNGVLNKSKKLSEDLSGMLNKYVQHLQDGNMEAAEGAWKYFQKSAAPYLIFKYGTEPGSAAVGQGVKNATINSANEKTKKD